MKCLYMAAICIFLSLFSYAQWTDDVSKNLLVAGVNSSDIETIGVDGGKTWIAFYSQRGSGYEMRAQLLDSTGKKLFGENGMLISSKPSGSATFVFNVCINGRGELIIGYQYEINGVLNAALSKVDQQGNILWDGIVLGKGLSPYPAVLTTGETAVAWSNGTLNTVSLQVVASDGTIISPTPLNVYVGSATTSRGQVVANNNGDFTLVFQKLVFPPVYTTLYARRYNHNLQPLWQAPAQLSDQTTSAARYYSVSAEADTTYVGYYSSAGSRFNAFLQRINPNEANSLPYGLNGTHFSTDTAVNDNYQQDITISQIDSTPTVWAICTYSDPNQVKYGVYAQRFIKTTGERLFGDKAKRVLTVSTKTDRQQGELQLTGNDKAGFIFSDSINHIYSTKLDNKGNVDSTVGTVLLASTSNAKSRIHFAANDVVAVAIWSENKGTDDYPFAQNVTADGITGVLPVVLNGFSAVRSANAVTVQWTTTNEINTKGFYVERSANGRNYSSLGFTAAKNSGASATNEYRFTDHSPLAATGYYRLRIVDISGQIVYSNVVKVAAGLSLLSRVYPNPAHGIVYVEMESSKDAVMTAVVTNTSGNTVLQKSIAVTAGTNRLPLNVNRLSSGSYFITITGYNGNTTTLRFNKL